MERRWQEGPREGARVTRGFFVSRRFRLNRPWWRVGVLRRLVVAGALVLGSAIAVVGASQPASADTPMAFPTMSTCNIKTLTGNYVTAVGGGGHDGVAFDALHTDATVASGWETFT